MAEPKVTNEFVCPQGDGYTAESVAELQAHVAAEHSAVLPKAEPIEPSRADDENLATCWVQFSEVHNSRDLFIRFIPRSRIGSRSIAKNVMPQLSDVDLDDKGRVLGVHLSWFEEE